MNSPQPADKTGAYEPVREHPEARSAAVESGQPLSGVASVLKALGDGQHALPRVQLRDPDAETLAPVDRPFSAEMPSDSQLREADGRIRLDGEIARGGMGAILKGRDTDLGRDIAVKVLLEAHAGRPDMVQRFVEEAQIAGQLQHPGIAPVYELGRFANRRPYFTMKLVKGKTLAALLASRHNPNEEQARFVGIFAQVCQTLAYAHARGVIHRDLKPSNIMVGAFGEVQVMDWGLAKVLQEGGVADEKRAQPRPDVSVIRTQRSTGSDASDSSSNTQAGSVLGTPAYMAPEQACGEVDHVDERSDVFGLGAILCEILTGSPPYVGRSNEQVQYMAVMGDLQGALARLAECGADAELVNLALRCLSAEPRERPRDAGKVAQAVTNYQHSVAERLQRAEVERAAEQVRAEEEAKQRVLSDQLAAAAQSQATAERRRRRVTLALAASVLATVLLGGAAFLWYMQERQARLARQDLALQEVQLLHAQATGADEDAVARWQEARLALEKATGVIGSASSAQAQLAELKDAIEKGLALAEADDRLVARLDRIRSSLEGKQADLAYEEAFAAAGLDLSAPETMIDRLRGRPLVLQAVVEALDAWSVVSGEEAGEAGAKRVLKAAQTLDPDDPWRQQLRDALERREPDGFRRLADQKDVLKAQGPVSLWLLGHSLEKLNDHVRALDVLRLGQRNHPDDYWLNLELGLALLSGQRTGTGTYATLLRLLQGSENYRAAEPYLTAAVALRPRFAPAHALLALVQAGQDRIDEAIDTVRRSIALDSNYSMAHNDLGLYLLQQNKRDEAVEEIRLALELDPKNHDAQLNLSYALRLQGKADEAARIMNQIVAVDPKDASAQNFLGDALVALGKPDEAMAAFRRSIDLDPKNAWPHSNLGDLLRTQGKVVEAIDEHRKAIELLPRDAELHKRLAEALDAHGEVDEAIAESQRSIALNSKNVWAHYLLGTFLRSQGKRDAAIDEFRTTIALDPKNTWAHWQLGYSLQNKGELDGAIKAYRQAAALDRKHVMAHWGLGRAYCAQGKIVEAVAEFRRAVAIEPSSVWLSSELARAEWMLAAESKLPSFLKGEFEPQTSEERIGLAGLCQAKKKYRAGAQAFADAFAADSTLAGHAQTSYRYAAAECAALAGTGAGEDATESETERARWRRQARDWLRADLDSQGPRIRSGFPGDRFVVLSTLRHWQVDSDLAGIRDKESLAKLPAEEQKAWNELWADVAAALKESQESK
jgi:tetratricopeptide (TPR) repeat protein/tRNA A-37 threonylcarbamoyl transferase component Bud32